MDVQKALDKAKEVSDKAHGVYSKANIPHWARGANPAAQTARMYYMFKTFAHNYLLTMQSMGFTSKESLYMMISPAILGGATASVLSPILVAFGKAAGLDDPEEDFYEWAAETFGDAGEAYARFGMAGLGGHGISLKGSLEIGYFDIPTTIGDWAGAPGSVVGDFIGGAKEISRGNISKGAERILPLAIGSGLKARREYVEGATTRNNTPIFYGNQQIKNTIPQAVLRAFSFNPAGIARKKEKKWNESRVISKYATWKRDIRSSMKKFMLSPPSKRSKDKWGDILMDIRDYNDRVRDPKLARMGIKPINIRKTITSIKRRSFRPPKRERMRKVQ